MRSHNVLASAAPLIVGFGVKVFYFSSPDAAREAQAKSTTMDVRQMQLDYPNEK
jgi:hypothetical protein